MAAAPSVLPADVSAARAALVCLATETDPAGLQKAADVLHDTLQASEEARNAASVALEAVAVAVQAARLTDDGTRLIVLHVLDMLLRCDSPMPRVLRCGAVRDAMLALGMALTSDAGRKQLASVLITFGSTEAARAELRTARLPRMLACLCEQSRDETVWQAVCNAIQALAVENSMRKCLGQEPVLRVLLAMAMRTVRDRTRAAIAGALAALCPCESSSVKECLAKPETRDALITLAARASIAGVRRGVLRALACAVSGKRVAPTAVFTYGQPVVAALIVRLGLASTTEEEDRDVISALHALTSDLFIAASFASKAMNDMMYLVRERVPGKTEQRMIDEIQRALSAPPPAPVIVAVPASNRRKSRGGPMGVQVVPAAVARIIPQSAEYGGGRLRTSKTMACVIM